MAYAIKEHWDEEHSVARCVLTYQTSMGIPLQGVGIAECHPEDMDFVSELTGSTIACFRAEIDLFKKISNYEIKPAIAALKHVYCTMKDSKHYSPKSYEAIRIKKELAHLMDELQENKNAIAELQDSLKNYIDGKDKLYKKIREGQK